MYVNILKRRFVWGAKCVKNDVKRPIYISLPHIYIECDIYISGVIFIYIWVRFIYMGPICTACMHYVISQAVHASDKCTCESELL